ncbi:hypothetical protein BV22DRAFT_1040715 [Leucogyrophana mollusca]|uniref:Uncharacterized protein n=1 Tax=Leucogyrophana mollusca TaxID=85980 RepID=A0ACB8B332_9AGAM|nr:hypothetical protein BV22DRAFT_1040715 [Leucogyrophana mollusca]
MMTMWFSSYHRRWNPAPRHIARSRKLPSKKQSAPAPTTAQRMENEGDVKQQP